MSEVCTLVLRPVSAPDAHCSAVTQFIQLDNVECLANQSISQSIDQSGHSSDAINQSIVASLSSKGDQSINLSSALITSSRDAAIKVWDLSNNSPIKQPFNQSNNVSVSQSVHPVCTLSGHSDWVNSIVCLNDHRTLISASSDQSIKLWDLPTGICSLTLVKHSDYIEKLAISQTNNLLVSAGLNNELFVWKLDANDQPRECLSLTKAVNQSNNQSTTVSVGSIYALSINQSLNCILAGGTDRSIRGFDWRSGKVAMKFSGHDATVRDIQSINHSTNQMISLSADNVVRVWDLRKQRSINQFTIKSSLMLNETNKETLKPASWTMAIDQSTNQSINQPIRPTRAYVAGSTGSIVELDLTTGRQQCVAKHTQSINALHIPNNLPINQSNNQSINQSLSLLNSSTLWCGSVDSSIVGYDLSINQTLLVRQQSFDEEYDDDDDELINPSINQTIKTFPLLYRIPGISPIKRSKTLMDGWHILCETITGEVLLFDMINQSIVTQYEDCEFEQLLEKKNQSIKQSINQSINQVVPKWFSVDHKLGCLSISLSKSSALAAERAFVLPAVEADPSNQSNNQATNLSNNQMKFNLGLNALRTAFLEWMSLEKVTYILNNQSSDQGEQSADLTSDMGPGSSLHQSINQSAKQSINHSSDQAINDVLMSPRRSARLIHSVSNDVIDHSARQFVGQSIKSARVRDVNLSVIIMPVNQSNNQPNNQSINQSIKVPNVLSVPIPSLPAALAPRMPSDQDEQSTAQSVNQSITELNEESLMELDRRRTIYYQSIPQWIQTAIFDQQSRIQPPDGFVSHSFTQLDGVIKTSSFDEHHELTDDHDQSIDQSIHHSDEEDEYSQSHEYSVSMSQSNTIKRLIGKSPASVSFFPSSSPPMLALDEHMSVAQTNKSIHPSISQSVKQSNKHPVSKIQFKLLPDPESGLPSIIGGSLSIPETMTVKTIKQYLSNKLSNNDSPDTTVNQSINLSIYCCEQDLLDVWNFVHVRDTIWSINQTNNQTMKCFYKVKSTNESDV